MFTGIITIPFRHPREGGDPLHVVFLGDGDAR